MEWPIITKNTSLEEVKCIHQQIWDYAAQHGLKPTTPYYADCVACEYDNLMSDFYQKPCTKCPIVWGGGMTLN